MGSDKRLYERFAVRLPVTLVHGDKRVSAHSRDISLGGMFVEIESGPGLPYGTAFTLEVHLPALPGPSTIEATVRWAGPTGMGVQFGSLRARETWAINQLVRK